MNTGKTVFIMYIPAVKFQKIKLHPSTLEDHLGISSGNASINLKYIYKWYFKTKTPYQKAPPA
jgi:hypothetical protein